MQVIISAVLNDKSDMFIEGFKSLVSGLGLELDDQFTHHALYMTVSEPMISAPEPVPELPPEPVADVPAAEPEMAMAIELPTEEPIVAPEPEMTITPPSVELDKEPEAQPEPTPVAEDQGPHIIVSLSASYEVDTVRDSSVQDSKLEVGSAGVNQNAIDFWFNGIEFFMPAVDDSIKSSVINPEHEIKPNTMRIVVSKVGVEGAYAMLVDVEAPNPDSFQKERLIIGQDVGKPG